MTGTTNSPRTNPIALADLPEQVKRVLAEFFSARREGIARIGEPVTHAVTYLEDFVLGGGKRIRPMYAWAGFHAAGGWQKHEYNSEAVLRAVSSLELIQACALIHDDIIDSSDTRRGNPTVHKRAQAWHQDSGWLGSPEHFGISTSILVGDLAMVWADDMFHGSGLPHEALERAASAWRGMRTEVIGGQLLDITNEAAGSTSLELAHNVNRFKTAAYTIERPLHIGAALAGASPEVIAALRAYGHDIGIAFQLRDDLLGVFGDPATTGKPAGDDLREGKRTELVATAIALAEQAGKHDLARHIGESVGTVTTQEEISQLAQEIADTGAAEAVERHIDELTASGLAALEEVALADDSLEALRKLAIKATARKV